jgi:hypothetical protein
VATIEGTHNPTNIPAGLFAVRPIPNHKETENRKERNADSRIRKSPLLNKKSSSIAGQGNRSQQMPWTTDGLTRSEMRPERGAYFGSSTASITWMMPFEASMSGFVTFA